MLLFRVFCAWMFLFWKEQIITRKKKKKRCYRRKLNLIGFATIYSLWQDLPLFLSTKDASSQINSPCTILPDRYYYQWFDWFLSCSTETPNSTCFLSWSFSINGMPLAGTPFYIKLAKLRPTLRPPRIGILL